MEKNGKISRPFYVIDAIRGQLCNLGLITSSRENRIYTQPKVKEIQTMLEMLIEDLEWLATTFFGFIKVQS